MCIDLFLFAAIIAELFLGFFLGFLGVFLIEPCEDTRSEYENYLWQVLLRGESLPPKDSLTKNLLPDSSEKSIRLIHALLNAIPEINNLKNKQGSESKKQYFNALDPKTKKTIWSILELARLEHDNLKFRRPPKNGWVLWLDFRSPQDLAEVRDSIDQKIQLLKPLLDLSEAIQPTSPYERFLKTTADLMAHVSDQDRQSLDLALSDCVCSMTRR
jgi:hypothetical protein